MSKHVTIHLQPADANSRSYGILMESTTRHAFGGRGIHNPSFDHRLDVWVNRRRDDYAGQAEAFRDPQGRMTAEPYSYLWKPEAVVIGLNPAPRPERGLGLALGDVVTLLIHGYSLGDFQIRARRTYDPHMVPVDTSSSASRQHYIETGDYLSPGEEA